MKTLSMIMAMETEAEGLIKALSLKPTLLSEVQTPFLAFEGKLRDDLRLTLTLAGKDKRFGVDNIGTEPAAVATFATVAKFKPNLIINAGTAGSFSSKGASVGKVYLSRKAFYFHDHRIPIVGWREFGRGAYPSVDTTELAQKLGLDQGDVSSGNSLDFTSEDLRILEENGAILKEMEAGAIAWVAWITATPFFAIKAVTNLIDLNPDSPKEFEKNFAVAVRELTAKTLSVLDVVSF